LIQIINNDFKIGFNLYMIYSNNSETFKYFVKNFIILIKYSVPTHSS